MASSTPGSAPPSVGRAPIVAALQGSQRPLPRLPGSPGPYARAWRRLRADRVGMVMLAYLALLVAAVIVLPVAIAIDPFKQSLKDSRFARIVRGSVLSTKHELFIEAARSVGASERRVAFAHVMPQVLGPVITIATFGLATAIFSIAALSFLGLGAQPPAAEWGLMLSDARRYLRIAWWLAVFPGITVTSVVLAANLLGDAVRDALDPRLFSKAD